MPKADQFLRIASRQMSARNHQGAVATLRKALRRRPQDVEAQSRLAHSLQHLGRIDEAETAYRKAIGWQATYAPAYVGLGTLFLTRGDSASAALAFQQALQLEPDRIDANFGLANASANLGQFGKAARHYGRVLKIDPRHVPSYNNLGNVFREIDNLEASAKCLQQAVRLAADVGDYHYNLGLTLNRLGEHTAATASFSAAVERMPKSADALGALAKNYESENQLAAARHAATTGESADPDHILCNIVLAICDQRRGAYEQARERLERIRPLASLDHERQFVCGELGRVLDKAGHHKLAFAAFSEANQWGASSCGPAAAAARQAGLEEIAQLASVFQPAALADAPPPLPWDRSQHPPVFLVGFPRSGTTLLDQALDAHPAIQTLSEKPALAAVKQQIQTWFTPYTRGILHLDDEQTRIARSAYYAEIDRHIDLNPEQVLVDKHPLNIRHLGLIHRLFPDSKVIVALRHPYDCCLSCFMQLFQHNAGMSHFLSLDGAATFYAHVMTLWQQYMHSLDLDQYVLRYELLVEHFERELRSLLAFLELPWSDRVLNYVEHASTRVRITTPSYRQVVEPIYQSARYRWRNYAEQLRSVAAILDPLVDRLGYADDTFTERAV